MAAVSALTVSVLMRVGHGKAAEVGTFELPLTVDVVNEHDLVLVPDFEGLQAGLRSVLLEAAEAILPPPPPVKIGASS